MVQMAQINDELDVKELPKEISLRGVNKGGNLNKPFSKGVHKERYISSDDFRKRAIKKVHKFCDKHGIL